MLARTHRFHGYNSLNPVYKQGQTVRGSLFGLRYLPNPRRQNYRLAVVVSRKVNKSAFTRNRIRRRLFEAVRTQPSEIGNFDLVLTVFNDQVATLPPAELQKMVDELLSKGPRKLG